MGWHFIIFERCLANRQFIIVDNNKNALDPLWQIGKGSEWVSESKSLTTESKTMNLILVWFGFRASSAMSTCFRKGSSSQSVYVHVLGNTTVWCIWNKNIISTYPNWFWQQFPYIVVNIILLVMNGLKCCSWKPEEKTKQLAIKINIH